jgi:hypothetical protein
MSIDTCIHCGDWVDTDDDVDCYITITHDSEICVCERCREKMEEDYEQAMEP